MLILLVLLWEVCTQLILLRQHSTILRCDSTILLRQHNFDRVTSPRPWCRLPPETVIRGKPMGVKRKETMINVPGFSELSMQQAIFVIEYCKDFDPRRAASAARYQNPDYGYKLIHEPEVSAALDEILRRRMEESDIDAEWLLYEAMDNHRLARQAGNLSASNKALELIGKMALVDAFAAEKVELSTNQEVVDRLIRGRLRARAKASSPDDDAPVSFT